MSVCIRCIYVFPYIGIYMHIQLLIHIFVGSRMHHTHMYVCIHTYTQADRQLIGGSIDE